MTPGAKRRERYLASRGVQAAFLIVLVALWYLATSRWHVSPILLPSPVAVLFQLWDIISTGEFVGDLAVTLRALAAARCRHRGPRRLPGRLLRQPLALPDPRVRAAVRRHLCHPHHPLPSALCAVLRARPRLQDRARRDNQLLSHCVEHHRRLWLCR